MLLLANANANAVIVCIYQCSDVNKVPEYKTFGNISSCGDITDPNGKNWCNCKLANCIACVSSCQGGPSCVSKCFNPNCGVFLPPDDPIVAILLEGKTKDGDFNVFITITKDIFFEIVINEISHIKKLINWTDIVPEAIPSNVSVFMAPNKQHFIIQINELDSAFSLVPNTNTKDLFLSKAIDSTKIQYNLNQLTTFLLRKEEEAVTFAPNPFDIITELKIKQALLELGPAKFEMTDKKGVKVREIPNITSNTTIVQRENLPPGIYFYTVTIDNKIIGRNKLIIHN